MFVFGIRVVFVQFSNCTLLTEVYLQDGYASLKGFPKTLWVALFVEGTRYTKAKLQAAQEFATSSGLRVPRHVLVPRTKVAIVNLLT